MAELDIVSLAEPVSDEEPCGPDLEELGDPEYWQFTGAIETDLPTSFDTFFEARAGAVDYSDKVKACYELLERTRDLRLVVWLAKLCVLSRDLPGFVDALGLVAKLMETQWDEVHPKPFEGDQTMRMVTLERLDERPSIELPLQYVRLIEDQTGPVAFRDHLVAEGEVQPREGERFRSGDDLRKTLTRCDVELVVDARDRIDAARQSVTQIRNLWLEKAGYDQAMQLERLPTLLEQIFTYLDTAVRNRRPDLAGDAPEETADTTEAAAGDSGGAATVASAPSVPRGAIKSPHDVVRALRAVLAYFEAHEPSSPARLLVMQSEKLVGRSWIDVVQTLLPDYYDAAFISVQGASPFRLPLSALSDRLQIGSGYDEPPTYGEGEEEEAEASSDDGWGSGWGEEETSEDESEGESEGDGEDETRSDEPAEAAAPAKPATFEVHQRTDAGTLLLDVITYYRQVEPSSPLPALLDRAHQLLSRDFTAIIQEITAAQEE